MVAYTSYSSSYFPRHSHCYWRRISRSSFYLYTFLTNNIVQNQDRYKTILVIVTGLLVFSWILKLPILIKISMVVGVVAIFIPIAAKGIEWLWMKLAFGMGWVNSRILLTLVYFLFLFPLAWVSRLFTKDPLMLKQRGLPSLYATRDHLYKKEDLENIW